MADLRARGEGVVVLGGERRRVRPIEAKGAERRRLWRRFATVTPVARYERVAQRQLPVVRLRPVFA